MQSCGVAGALHYRGVSSFKKCVQDKSIVKGVKSSIIADFIRVTGCIVLELSWIPGRIDSAARGVLL